MGRGMTRGAAVLVLTLAVQGCWVTPADPQRLSAYQTPALPDEFDWPARQITTDPAIGPGVPDWVVPCGAFGAGFLYELNIPPPPEDERYQSTSLVFLSCAPTGTSGRRSRMTSEAGTWLLPAATNTMSVVIGNRTDRPIVGTCIYLASLMGVTDQERPLLRTLSDDGWRLIVVWPSIETYDGAFFALPISAGDDANASTLAREEDSYLAGAAYAAEAAARWVEKKDPAFSERPVVVVGSSLGALSGPAVVARLRSTGASRVDAAVLIGGGTGLLRILSQSPVMRDRFMLMGFRPVPGDEDQYTVTAYNGDALHDLLDRATVASRLDPASTAAGLRDIPVLQLHATQDRIVPAGCGDDLHERLGRPERWCYALGHTGLFLVLPFEADDIARWIRTTVMRSGPSASPLP